MLLIMIESNRSDYLIMWFKFDRLLPILNIDNISIPIDIANSHFFLVFGFGYRRETGISDFHLLDHFLGE
jgi:hypothetical protein